MRSSDTLKCFTREDENMTKKIYIPGYVRANGFRVRGHFRVMTETKSVRSGAATKGWEKRRMKA